MAAVAAEPGAAAAASTTAGDGVDYDPEPGEHVDDLDARSAQDFVPETELCHQPEDVDAVQECSHVQMEIRRPDLQAAGKALAAHADCEQTETGDSWGRLDATEPPVLMDYRYKDISEYGERLKESYSPKVEVANEVSTVETSPCLLPSPISDSQPSVVFLHSLPTHPSEPETGLSLAEPAEPTVESVSSHPTDIECELIGFTQPEPEPANDAPGSEHKSHEDAFHDISHPPDHLDSVSIAEETSLGESMGQSCISDFSTVSSKDSPELPAVADQSLISSSESEEVRSHPLHHQSFNTDLSEPDGESETKPPVLCAERDTVGRLVPGSEVLVSLDHIIDDALVVSFRLGEKIFSGVLMDLSKRFGPYGIPITVFPKREYKDKPESMQLKTEAFQSETDKGITEGPADAPVKDPVDAPLTDAAEAPAVPQPCPNPQPNPWTSKPPPLFQEGAPYPPPLFIRDTYNQSLPQPLPRKIKRPKRRLYREEPTSIMNAIKLRPRQVLCDKCKGAVVQGDKRETRRGPISDCRSDDAKRRRNDNTTAAAGKRPRNDPRSEDKGRGTDGPKRQASAIRVSSSTSSSLGQVKGAAAGNKVMKGVSSTTPSSANPRLQLNAKKVLQSKNVDHSKARDVLKMAKAQRGQKETVTGSGGKALTRAAALQEAHQKVHFTRRLQQISGGGPGSNPLPPRMRIKPQRYRNEENDSSSCKPPCLEKVPGGGRLALPKPAASRCTSTRSSSCSASQATNAVEPTRSDRTLESLLSTAQPDPQMLPAPEYREPQAEPEEQEGQEEKRETRGSKAGGNLVVYMTLNPSKPDSSSTSMCSIDSADDLKSSNSECSSTETFDFPPPGDLRSAPAPGTSSAFASASPSAPKDDKKRSKSLKAAVYSKNVSKYVTLDGRTICVGDIVWAKILGFPWWPARILAITVSRKDNGLLVRQEARVAWFGSPTTSFLAITQLAPFLENFQSRFDKKRKGLYRKAITEAAKAAKQLTPEVRALLTQFET